MEKNRLEDFTERLIQAIPPGLQAFKEELQGNFKAILQNILKDLQVVSHEEFKAQVQVLANMQKKLQALEEQIQALECEIASRKEKQNEQNI